MQTTSTEPPIGLGVEGTALQGLLSVVAWEAVQ